jgi:hypothetical protein
LAVFLPLKQINLGVNDMKPQIINIINFVRGVEPRYPELDLTESVRQQIKLLKQYGLTGTFLLQYDAILRDDIVEMMKEDTGALFEVGAWLEVVQPLVEKAGIKWKGRPGYSWDWHTDAGFTIAYTPEERELILDTYMRDFRDLFGYYPRSAGAWVIDAHSLAYLTEKYGILAFCNCRDQWGTDGYTLWGGYYGQAYYPSRFNAFTPASSTENQINVPVFRMLGSDPIYQYDSGMDEQFNSCEWQDVITLEPAYTTGGGSPEWVRWFFKENFNGLCLSFGYAQVGQENSFGWESMKKGYEDQMNLIAQEAAAGRISVMTLKDAGINYKSAYKATPASVIAALSDWKNEGRKSVWYCSRYYRTNLLWENGRLYIRDIHLFDELYRERYLEDICTTEGCVYDNLPLMDGSRWSGNGERAGIYPVMKKGSEYIPIEGMNPVFCETGDEVLEITWPLKLAGVIKMRLSPQKIEICYEGVSDDSSWAMKFNSNNELTLREAVINKKFIQLRHNNHSYGVRMDDGFFIYDHAAESIVLHPNNGRISLVLGF